MVWALQTAASMTNRLSASSRLPLLLLVLLAPAVGLAAGEPALAQRPPLASSGLPGTQEQASPRLMSEDSWPQQYERSPPSRVERIAVEIGAGLLTGVIPGIVGGYLGTALCEAGVTGPAGSFMPCLGSALAGMLVGGSAGFSLGVWWGGELSGGDGALLGSLGGFGTFAALGTVLALTTGVPVVGLLVGVPLSLFGSIVGYELTQRTVEPSFQARVQPVLAFSSHGAVMGLGGRF